MNKEIFILIHSVDYENSQVLGVFDNFDKANNIRNEIIKKGYKNRKADDTYSGGDFHSLRFDDCCYIIETFKLNIKKRDF